MENSTILSKKLAGYSSLALAMAGISSHADAQITYSGVKNEAINTNTTKTFDLDVDGNIDFRIENDFYSFSGYSNNNNHIYAYAGGVIQDPNMSWAIKQFDADGSIAGNDPNFSSIGYFDNFITNTDKFIGVKFTSGATNYVGWMRINMASDRKSFTVIDWAYAPAPNGNESILAGDKGTVTAIKSPATKTLEASVYPNPFTDAITVAADNATGYEFISLTGAVVEAGSLTKSEETIPTTGLAKGIYLLKITTTEGVVVKRVEKK